MNENNDFEPIPETVAELLAYFEEYPWLASMNEAVVTGDYQKAHEISGQLSLIEQLKAWHEETQLEILKASRSTH